MKEIYCLLSIENLHDQPYNNLVCWWVDIPKFEQVLSAIGGLMDIEKSILAAARILENKVQPACVKRRIFVRYDQCDYALVRVEEGKLLNEEGE